jgi:hypothetical protein
MRDKLPVSGALLPAPAGLQLFREHPFAIGKRMFDQQLNRSTGSLLSRWHARPQGNPCQSAIEGAQSTPDKDEEP